jgi:surface protein
MFNDASAFNQDLSNWDVSEGTDFVSNDQSVRFDSILGFRVKSIPDVWLFKEKALSTNLVFHLFLVLVEYV